MKKYPIGMTFDYQALKHTSYSIGFGIMRYDGLHGYKKAYHAKLGTLIDIEYMPKDNILVKNIYGFKLNAYLAGPKFLVWGFSLAHFTNFSQNKWVIIPEFGIGYRSFFIVYRRNIKIINNGLNHLNVDNISLRIYMPLDKRWFKLKN